MGRNRYRLFKSVEVELQSLCNRDCPFCNRYNDRSGFYKDEYGRPIVGYLSTDKALDIINQLEVMKYEGLITFSNWSEPFLDKRVISIAREAKIRGIHPYINTNGDVLKNNSNLCQQASEVFEVINVGIYDCDNENDIEVQEREWRERLSSARVTFSLPDRMYMLHNVKEDWFKTPKQERVKSIINRPCFHPERRLIIRYDGEVMLCCEDMTGAFELGNLYNRSIKDIWWSEKRARIVATLARRDGRKKYALCQTCPRGYRQRENISKFALGRIKVAVASNLLGRLKKLAH